MKIPKQRPGITLNITWIHVETPNVTMLRDVPRIPYLFLLFYYVIGSVGSYSFLNCPR